MCKAKAALAPVELKSGYAHEDRISFNRRFHMKDGSVRFNPPTNSPDIVRAGRADRSAGRNRLAFQAGREANRRARLFRLPCTSTRRAARCTRPTMSKSLDDRLKKSFGPEFTLLFGTGTCGDINHRDVTKQEQRKADELGAMLGDTVVSAIEKGEVDVSGSEPSLAVRSTKVAAPLQTYSAGRNRQGQGEHAARRHARAAVSSKPVEACKIIDLERLKKSGYPCRSKCRRFA